MHTYLAFSALDAVGNVDCLSKYLNGLDVRVSRIMPLGAINGLLKSLQFHPNELAQRLNPEGPKDFQLYILPDNFISRFCAYGKDHLEAISARWANEEYWEMVEVNPFDLYGFLLEFQDYCRAYEAKAGRIICAITAD